MDIPVFKAVMNDTSPDHGVQMVSFVEQPATGASWLALSANKSAYITLSQEDERKVFGPVLVPDQYILRTDQQGNPYYLQFDADTIERVRDRFMLMAAGRVANPQHMKDVIMDNVYMTETFISGGKLGLQPPAQFSSYPQGTWFSSFKVDNDYVWNDFIKGGKFTGFSIEGLFASEFTGKTAGIEANQQFAAADIADQMLALAEEIKALKAKRI